MLTLRFDNGRPEEALAVGPAPWFRVAGNFIRQGPHGHIAGTFRLHHWEINGRYFERYDCDGPVLVHFEDAGGGASETFGPFRESHALDGVLRADGELFAKFMEETQLWHCFATETFWPVIVLKSAEPLKA